MGDDLVALALQRVLVDLHAETRELVEPEELGADEGKREDLAGEMAFPEGEETFLAQNGRGTLGDATVL